MPRKRLVGGGGWRREGLNGREGREGVAERYWRFRRAAEEVRPYHRDTPQVARMAGGGGGASFKHVESDAMGGLDRKERRSVVALTKRRDIRSRRGA